MTTAEIAQKPINEILRSPVDIYSDMGVIALDNGLNLRKPVPHEFETTSDEQARLTLGWLLTRPADVIKDSFAPADQLSVQPLDSDVSDLRSFTIGLVQRVTGQKRQEAIKTIADKASFVTTVVNGIANSPEYRDRLHWTERPRLADGSAGNTLSFAAMQVEPAAVPEIITRVGSTMISHGDEHHSVQTISIESSLRNSNPQSTVVLKQIGDDQPQLFERYYKRGKYLEKPADPKSEQQYFVALIGDLGSAFANYRPEDNARARAAAGRGYII